MSEKEYYNLKGYINSSSLKYLDPKGEDDPLKFKRSIEGELEQEEASYLNFGKLVHLYVLEKEVFDATVRVMDYTTPKSSQQKKFLEDFLEYRLAKLKVEEALLKAYRNNYTTKEKDETILKKALAIRETYKTYEKYLQES